MSTTTLPGTGGVRLAVDVIGDGPLVLLLHGFPQTKAMWRHVAPRLATDHTVACADLRGYGASDKPAPADPDAYSKRTMAADAVALAHALGHDRFALIGHDRGALVAHRAALDHPEAVTHVGLLDVLPTLDTWDVLHGVAGAPGWHLYLMAQPAPLPETLIANSADAFFGSFLDDWTKDAAAIPADVRRHYLDACAAAVPSIVADYRATATVDLEHDEADRAAGRTIRRPSAVLQQDYGAAMGFDAAARWRAWAPDVDHALTTAGHFMAEERPDEVTAWARRLLSR